MKLFGNKRHADHAAAKLTVGQKKGIIFLVSSVVLLVGSVVGFVEAWHDFAQPIERSVIAETLEGENGEVWVPPTKTETVVEIDEQTGEERIVEIEVPASKIDGIYNILIVGTDGDGYRTDTIMIAHININTCETALLSIPRDTVITGNYTVPKINGVYGAAGGGEKGIQALEIKLAQLLGFDVDGYAIVDLEAFVELVDLVGGVDYEVPMDMHYEDPTQDLYIHLNAGWQHLDGEHAIQLVRYRKGYARQDIDRTGTQQNFLKELAKACAEKLTIADIGKVAKIFKQYVVTDLSLGNIAYFGENLLNCDFDEMFTYTLQGEPVMINDASCWAIYRQDTLNIVNEYFNPFDTVITAADVQIIAPEDVPPPPPKEEEEEDSEADETEEELPDDELFEEAEPEEETEPEEELPEEQLPTDEWVEELPEEDDTFWPGR